MPLSALDYLGWTATVVFVASYFCGGASALRRTQMAGAAIWVVYGGLLKAYPVVVANALVFAAAAWSTRSSRQPSS
jgi:hypothetical protein